MSKSTGVIILNYNNITDTINCINSVEKYNTHNIKYIIVDNGSREEVVSGLDENLKLIFKDNYLLLNEGEEISQKLGFVTLLASKTNDGYARGNNKGLTLAYQDDEIETILILNSDILFTKDIIPGLITSLNELPNAGIVSPLLYKKNGIDIDYDCCRREQTLTDIFITHLCLCRNPLGITAKIKDKNNLLYKKTISSTNPIIEIDLPSGSCMLLKKEFFKELNSFDTNTFLYYEENILFKKTSHLNKKNYLNSSLSCIHLGATTTKSTVSSQFTTKCWTESNYYYLTHYTEANKIYLLFMKFFYNLMIMKSSLKTYWINLQKNK